MLHLARVLPAAADSAGVWFWDLANRQDDLLRAGVVAVALLAAFLTAVTLWEVPPGKPDALTRPAADPPPEGGRPLGLQGNFAKTVVTGLGGMASVSLLDESLLDSGRFDARIYYVVLFVVFFLAFLVVYAFVRGITEALRSRSASPWRPPAWTVPRRRSEDRPRERVAAWRFRIAVAWVWYWLGRGWRWLFSLRPALLVFADTAANVVVGRNQLKSVVWEQTIVDLQRTLVRTAEQVRQSVHHALVSALEHEAEGPSHFREWRDHDFEGMVRVNVSVLSEDRGSVYYLAPAPGSLLKPFPRSSLAWLSVYSGRPLWWAKGYPLSTRLFENGEPDLPDLPAGWLTLDNFWQERDEPDYRAFVILPFPRRLSGEALERKGAIQISFETERLLELVWDPREPGSPVPAAAARDYALAGRAAAETERWRDAAGLPRDREADPGPAYPYEHADEMLKPGRLRDAALAAVLAQSVAVLGELVQELNDEIFHGVLESRR